MKKIGTITTILLALVVMQVQAQDDAITKFFSKYVEDDDFTQVTVTSRMFGLFANLDAEDEEDNELMDAISKVKGLRILAKEDAEDGKALYKEAFSLIPAKDYDELMSIREKDSDMKFLIKEKDGKIAELLMIMGGDDEFFLLSLVGEIDLNQIAKLSRTMDIDGFDKLGKINEDSHDDDDHDDDNDDDK